MRAPRKPQEYWPSWRYGPNGESAIFEKESDVPYGWVKKAGLKFVPPEAPPVLDRSELEEQLRARGINPLGHWSARYMKELLEQ